MYSPDTEELKEDGLNLGKLALAVEIAMSGVSKLKSKESQWLVNHLRYLRDKFEDNED